MFDELTDMSNMCSIGHMNRLINVLSGFPQFHPKSFLDLETNKKEMCESMLHKIQVSIEQEPEEKQEWSIWATMNLCMSSKSSLRNINKPIRFKDYSIEYKS